MSGKQISDFHRNQGNYPINRLTLFHLHCFCHKFFSGALNQCFSTDGSRPSNRSWKISSGSWNFFYNIQIALKWSNNWIFCNIKLISTQICTFYTEVPRSFLLQGGSFNWSYETTKWDCFSFTTQKLRVVVKNGSRSDLG